MKVRNENYTNLNLEEILFKIVVALINKVNTSKALIFVTCNFIFFILLDLYFVRILLFLLRREYTVKYFF